MSFEPIPARPNWQQIDLGSISLVKLQRAAEAVESVGRGWPDRQHCLGARGHLGAPGVKAGEEWQCVGARRHLQPRELLTGLHCQRDFRLSCGLKDGGGGE